MIIHARRRWLAYAFAAVPLASAAAQAAEPMQLPEVTVTATREGALKSETPAAVTTIGGDAIAATKPAHPSEMVRGVPGAVIMQTNGEGHTTGIRQPIGTDPVYLYLEDGIPTRATGFFNHNALVEVDLPNADGIEITRGPGSALQGSDAIGAVFNVLTKAPPLAPEAAVTVEGGSWGWARLLATGGNSWGDSGARGTLNLTHSDGWRDGTGYDRQSATIRVDHALSGDATLKAVLTATNADMQTGANARLSKADYENNPTRNYHAIAFREVQALRASVAYERESGPSLLSLTPYIRWNEMELLPSFTLGSDPYIQTSGHASVGLQAKYRRDFAPWRTRVVTGADFDYSPGSHSEDRITRFKSGNFFTGYTRGPTIYDYDVTFMQASPFLHAETSPLTALRLNAGVRADIIAYDYDNRLADGAFASGAPGGAVFYRPADTGRDYSHVSPSLGATYAVTPALNAFARYKHSFRAPSESQLFRSGSNADTVHLQPVKVDNFEAGLRGGGDDAFSWEIAAYRMTKRDDILSTRESGVITTSTNNGKTRHTGIEAAVGWTPLADWRIAASGSYSRHRYVNWVNTAGDFGGKEISLAPRLVSSLAVSWKPQAGVFQGTAVEGEWTHLGHYRMDDLNTATYPGHDLFNLRGSYAINERLELFARMINVFDTRWATVAQFTGGREEFAPGMPRTLYGGVTARF